MTRADAPRTNGIMFRPWRQDDRPIWWTRVQHEVSAPLDPDDRTAVEQQALDTGLTRFAVVTCDDCTVSTYLLVKAQDGAEAEEASARIVEAAHREAAHGRLGRRLLRSATRYQPGAQLHAG